MKKYSYREDPELLGLYVDNNDEVVYFWIHIRYLKWLLPTARYISRDDQQADDVLSNVVFKLIKAAQSERPQKIWLTNNEVRVCMKVWVKREAIDTYRKNKKMHYENVQEGDASVLSLQGYDQMILDEIIAREMETLFRAELAKRLNRPEDLLMFDLLIKHGFGKLEALAEDMDLSKNEARVIKQRVKRNLLRIKKRIQETA
jgi:DNA-directed RNA polymerase specialized sigma24 family protein